MQLLETLVLQYYAPNVDTSAATAALIVPATARSTISDRAFSVAAAWAWNSLLLSVTSSASLPDFRKHLKTDLFTRSFPS